MHSRFKTQEHFLSYVLRDKSSVTNGTLKSSEIQILKESNQCKTIFFKSFKYLFVYHLAQKIVCLVYTQWIFGEMLMTIKGITNWQGIQIS